MMKSKNVSLKVETKKLDIENGRPENGKKKLTVSDVSEKNKKPKRVKVDSSINKSSAHEPKMFTIYEKRKMIEPLRKELLNRGWIEQTTEDCTTLPQLIWLSRSNGIVIAGSPIVNRLRWAPLKNFCFKDILLDYGRHANKKMELHLPRTFKLFSNERKEFIENYRLTAYCSFIRFLHATGSKTFSEKGTINSNWINYAIDKLEAAIVSNNIKKSKTKVESTKEKLEAETEFASDNLKSKANVISDKEKQLKDDRDFGRFKKNYQSIVKFKSKIDADSTNRMKLLKQCKAIYGECKKAWKDFEKGGFYNLWLLKPARRSLGIGIKLFDEDVDILSYAKDHANMKYLVQKYIERPMLIHDTKFDLRQYFLVVHHSTTICLWMYKMCYLKFSTKLYDPLNYKVSVHITNTAVQKKYSIDKNRSRNIPQCNEWSSDRFLAYLSRENKLNLWEEKIYPAMKKNIIATVSAAVDPTMIQPNHFQLYGSDFVIDEFHDPILLEINGFPILTSVICAMCIQDLVKVVVDARENPFADTGHFEKVWEKRI